MRRLSLLLQDRGADDGHLGVMLVRLQRLREFRFAHGFGASDDLVDAAEQRLRGVLRPIDEVHRIGEHDFVVLLPALHDCNHAVLAGGGVIRAFEATLQLGAREVLASIVIGTSVCPEHGDDPGTLLRRAELASAHAEGSSERHALYASGQDGARVPYELLRDAIIGNRLEVHLQPVMDLRQRVIVGVESLVRWTDPVRGPIPPDVFIPVAEETGLISELTRWSINASFRHASRARRTVPELGVSINLSPRVFAERDIVAHILSAMRIWGVSPAAVTMEVTETALMEDPALSLRLLEHLRAEGLNVAIDDFGSGYSSLSYLKRFPATELKIDSSFVLDLQHDARSVQLVRSIIDLGHHLEMTVVAEGVEDEMTLELLARLDCDRVQGFHVCRPQPAAAFIASLEADPSEPVGPG